MYQFKIRKLDEGGYRFELGDIKMLIDNYSITENRHLIINPGKAFAWFTVDSNIYGVSNESSRLDSVEAFFDAINLQHSFFTNKSVPIIDNTIAHLKNSGLNNNLKLSA